MGMWVGVGERVKSIFYGVMWELWVVLWSGIMWERCEMLDVLYGLDCMVWIVWFGLYGLDYGLDYMGWVIGVGLWRIVK